MAFGDPLCTAAAVLAVLRLDAGDVDAARIDEAVAAGSELIWHLDPAAVLPEPQPAAVTSAAVQVAIELYRRKDAPFGVLDAWGAAGIGPVRIGADPLAGVGHLLAPWFNNRGVG